MEQEQKKYSILDELAKCAGYDIALMTTFNFEIGFFERAVLNRLYAKDVKTVSVFIDSKELTSALNEFDALSSGSHMGRKYMVNPVIMQGSFHPKIILLLGEKKARLFVGSANIKTSGYATNNEVFNFIDYDANHPEYLDVIVNAIDFFESINDLSYKLDNAALRAAKEYIYYHKAERNGDVYLLHNMITPMLEQIKGVITEKVESIRIAVPYYDNELLALQRIKDAFDGAEISLYIQNNSSTFPVEFNKKHSVADSVNIFSGFVDNTSSTRNNFYHGKVFLFKTNEHSYVFYGSANCTLSAMAKTYSEGGNVECDLLEVGGISDFDYFFDNMELDVDNQLLSHDMTYDRPTITPFVYKYGIVNENIELHIAYANLSDNLVIKLGEKELDYKAANGEIVVTVGDEYCDSLTDIFDLTIIYADQKVYLRCWTFSPTALLNNREVQIRDDSLSEFEVDASGTKYIEDRMKFMKAEATCLNEWQEYKNNLKYMNQIKMEQENEGEDSDDFIVDYQIPDEYRYAYRQYNETSRIRNIFVKRFLGTSIFMRGIDKDVVLVDSSSSNKLKKTGQRKATSEEAKFERFIKAKVKGMMNDVYIEAIELEHYIGLVQVVMEIFDKYCDVEDIFQPEYVVQTTHFFMKKIIEKPLESIQNNEEMKEAIIKKGFQTILDIYIYYKNLSESEERWKFESLNKTLLNSIEKKYKLRQSYSDIIKQIIESNSGDVSLLGYEGACHYIEQLYGYKTYEMLCGAIQKAYPGAEVLSNGTVIRITVATDNIFECRRLDTAVLKEITNYGRSVSKVTMVYFDFINKAENPENKNIIVKLSHSINVDYHKWKYSEIRLNGDYYDSKTQYLSY